MVIQKKPMHYNDCNNNLYVTIKWKYSDYEDMGINGNINSGNLNMAVVM